MPDRDGYQYARGFVQINRIALAQAVEHLPRMHQAIARLFLLEGVLRANWENGGNPNGRDVLSLQRGEFPMGRYELATTLGTSPQSIRTVIALLVSVGIIASKTTNRGTIITLCHFDSYCGTPSQINQQPTSNQPATNHSKEVQEVQEVRTSLRRLDADVVPKESKRDHWIDEMAKHYQAVAPNGKVPISIFAKWRVEYGPELPLELMERLAVSGRKVREVTAYLARALQSERNRREETSVREDSILGDGIWEFPTKSPDGEIPPWMRRDGHK